MKKIKLQNLIIFHFTISIGVLLAVYQYLFNRSLWFDEAMLSINILNKDFAELLQPLDFDQVAPIGFLFAEKFFVILLGKNEFAMRIFPLLNFLICIPLFYLLIVKMTHSKLIALIGVSLFCLNINLLYYASEAKQYMTDVLVAVGCMYATLSFNPNKNRSVCLYACLGCIALFFSNIAVVILFVCGFYLLFTEVYKNKNYRLLLVFGCWLITFLLYYIAFIHNHPTKNMMLLYWDHAFLPMNPFSKEFYLFLYKKFYGFYRVVLGFDKFWILPLILTLSAVAIWLKGKKYANLFLILFPVACHLMLSALKLYPFNSRLILYLSPYFLFLIAMGAYHFYGFTKQYITALPVTVFAIPILGLSVPLLNEFPFERQEVRNSLTYLEKNIKSNEKLYVYYSSNFEYEFYKSTGVVSNNNSVIIGKEHRSNKHNYRSELSNLSGKVWLLFSHVYAFNSTENEENYIVNFLLSQGAQLIDFKKYEGSSIYLIDTNKKRPLEHDSTDHKNTKSLSGVN